METEGRDRDMREAEAAARSAAEEIRRRAAEAEEELEEAGRRYGRRGERKERVLHTRISEPLAEDIRRLAEDLRVPVSNLVRNVLEEAFSVVETVTDNVGDLIEDVVEEADRARERVRRRHRHRGAGRRHRSRREREEVEDAQFAERAEFPDVLGWQPLVLNQPQRCSDCEEALPTGERAFMGTTQQGPSSTWLCPDCMESRR